MAVFQLHPGFLLQFREDMQLGMLKNDTTSGISREKLFTAKYLTGVFMEAVLWVACSACTVIACGQIFGMAYILSYWKALFIVTMSFPSRGNQDLVREINCFLLEKQETERNWRTEELRLQEIISNISHDMRTSLTAVLGYIHLINTSELSMKKEKGVGTFALESVK